MVDTTAPHLRLALVDDSPEDIFLFRHAATQARSDIEIDTFLDADLLLQHLHTLAQQSPTALAPDLLLLDINMPRLNGIELLCQLKASEHWCHLPAVMFSTSSYRKDIERCYVSGAAGYVVKPSGNQALVDKLDRLFAYWIDTVEPANRRAE